nr:ribonuclease H-like domain-containing protein [Tanacetum cinerariifolium]
FFASQSTSPQIDNEDLKQIDVDDLKEMDLRWQMAMLTIRARRFLQKTRRNLGDNRATTMSFDMSKVECYNCHRKGHFARECRSPKDTRRIVVIKLRRSLLTLLSWLFHQQALLIMSQTNNKHGLGYLPSGGVSASLPLSYPSDRVQPSGGYNDVPLPITGKFMPPKPDLVFNTTPLVVESDHSAFNVQLSPAKPAQPMSHITDSMAPIIEDHVSDSEDESKPNDSQSAPSFLQPSEHVKLSGHFAQAPILDDTPKPTSSKTNGSRKRKNRKTYFVCRGVDHLIKDCNFHTKPKSQPTSRNSAYKGYDKPVSVTVPKIMAAKPRHTRSLLTNPNSIIKRHKTRSKFSKISNSSPKVTAANAKIVSVAKGKKGK